jgi:hypothetical protein
MSTESAPIRRLLRPIPKLKPLSARPQAALSPANKLVRIMPQAQQWPTAIQPRIAAPAGHIGADPDVLVVEDVARIVRCTVDSARRIPRDQLPAHPGPGRRQLYLREDVLAYVRSLGQPTPNADILMRRITGEGVDSASGSGRERSARRSR